ncbi:MAG TPA: fasciclin domain-containing protein [Allosphingosinicella sp.]|nr:fasciclin domain-containing protein [Allosphingosinicella sp.]
MMRKMVPLCLASALAACTSGDGGNQGNGANEASGNAQAGQARTSIAEALAASIDHSSFQQALQAAGLTDTLRGIGPYTVFAPTNAAFDAIPADARSSLTAPEQRDRLVTLLSYHIVPGTVTAEDLGRAIDRGQGGRAQLATVTGDNLTLSREGQAIVIADGAGGRARITHPDQLQSNGVLHSIDAVLMPGGAQ